MVYHHTHKHFSFYPEQLMSFEIRKIVSYVEETFIEGGKAADKPVTMVGLAVVSLKSAPTAPTSEH
jgi:hypothetical protein